MKDERRGCKGPAAATGTQEASRLSQSVQMLFSAALPHEGTNSVSWGCSNSHERWGGMFGCREWHMYREHMENKTRFIESVHRKHRRATWNIYALDLWIEQVQFTECTSLGRSQVVWILLAHLGSTAWKFQGQSLHEVSRTHCPIQVWPVIAMCHLRHHLCTASIC